MGAPKGHKKAGGRQKGTRNKLTTALKDMILQALSNKGGTAYLEAQADANPVAFLGLIGRVLPLQVKASDKEPTVPKPVYHDKIE